MVAFQVDFEAGGCPAVPLVLGTADRDRTSTPLHVTMKLTARQAKWSATVLHPDGSRSRDGDLEAFTFDAWG